MSYANPDALVETDWLAAHLADSNVKVLDASYHLPGTNRDAELEFKEQQRGPALEIQTFQRALQLPS